MKTKKVSIIITAYNSEKYVSRAINSVINQTYNNIELVFIDDCSNDKTFECAQRITKSFLGDFKLIKNKNNLGAGPSRNVGINESSGDWIYFLDCDDFIDKFTIECLCNNEDADVVFSSYDVVNDDFELSSLDSRQKPLLIDKKLIQKNFLKRKIKLLCPGTLYKKSFLLENKIQFESIRWSEDQCFLWRILKFANRMMYFNAQSYHYFVNNQSTMHFTSIDRIRDAYKSFCSLEEFEWEYKPIKKYLSARWALGTLNSYAHMANSFEEWKRANAILDARTKISKLLFFPEWKVKACAFLALTFPRIYYNLFRNRTDRR